MDIRIKKLMDDQKKIEKKISEKIKKIILKKRKDKILFIFDKKWFSEEKGRYYNVPAKIYINTCHQKYYRKLKIEVFLGIKYFDPNGRKKFKSVKALENLNKRKGRKDCSFKSLIKNGYELSIYEKSLLKRMIEVGTNILELTNVWMDLVSDKSRNGDNDIQPIKENMISDIKQLYKWSLEGDFKYLVDPKGKISKI